MNFSKINELKPYDLNCNIFDVYSYDGLSMQELLCLFFTKINECIKTSNETIDLAEWLVNEGLKQEVVLKLTKWLNDGTLEDLINVTLFENLNKKIDSINTQLEEVVIDINTQLEEIAIDINTQLEQIEIDIRKFGCKCDGVTNDLPKILEGLENINPPYNLKFPANTTTLIKGYIPLKSNVNYIGENSTIKQLKEDSPIFAGEGISNISFKGINFYGLGTDYVDNGKFTINTASGIYLGELKQNKNIIIENCKFENIGHASIYLRNTDNFSIKGCYLEGLCSDIITYEKNYQFGLRLIDKISNGVIENNHINRGSQGIYLDHEIDNVKVVNNTIENITGQHGLYCADGNNLLVINNIVKNIALDGIKIQLDNQNIRDSKNTIVNDNIFFNVGGNGVSFTKVGSTSVYRHKNITVSNNQLSGNVTASGININTCDDVKIHNNLIKGFGNGITTGDIINVYIDSNRIRECYQNGIANNLIRTKSSKDLYIMNNIITNCGQNERAGYEYGMYITNIDNLFIENNIIDSTDKKQRYCLFLVNTGTVLNAYINNNKFLNAKDFSIRFSTNEKISLFNDNYFINSLNIPTDYVSIQ